MNSDFDVIVVGSGPAGVSAAYPLVESGLRVLMVDGGRQATIEPPAQPFLSARMEDKDQWKWMVGADFHALQKNDAVSPKLRAPTLGYVFEEFGDLNRIIAEKVVAVGSLATGGLSNAWGCGVARMSEKELSGFPFSASEIGPSYEKVAKRMGISGRSDDDLADYFGVDAWSQPPIPMDALNRDLFDRYVPRKSKVEQLGFRLGRSRVAVLSEDYAGRQACNLLGNCLYGCHRRALYSAAEELPSLRRHTNFYEANGFIVTGMARRGDRWIVEGTNRRSQEDGQFSACKVILAAGTLATTGLVLRTLNYERSIRLLSCPTAAFMLWLPRLFGMQRESAFGLGQLSFALDIQDGVAGFGSTFGVAGIPVSEIVRHLPFRRRYGIKLLRGLLSSCLVGNLFLPGRLSAMNACLRDDGVLMISGGYDDSVSVLMAEAARLLRKAYWQLGAIVLPGSFTIGRPGGDIHYAGTIPMRAHPALGETNFIGEVMGLDGVHLVDGACLPTLLEKSHTLTIMANADRIGCAVASMHFRGGR